MNDAKKLRESEENSNTILTSALEKKEGNHGY
jgi:hypothetical protein